jgi:hypothetical protein
MSQDLGTVGMILGLLKSEESDKILEFHNFNNLKSVGGFFCRRQKQANRVLTMAKDLPTAI